MTTHTLPPEVTGDAEFERLVALGMPEAEANAAWLSGTASVHLTPFALRGLAHSFGLLIDRRAEPSGACVAPPEVKVRELEWEEIAATDYVATTIIGRYHIVGSGNEWSVGFPGKPDRDYFSTLAEAKAAAQADYNARIRSTLE